MPRFVDTNVLLYSISDDPGEVEKRRVAEQVFDASDLILSTQVLGEFYVQATRPSRPAPLTHERASALIDTLKRYPIRSITVPIVDAALAATRRHRISYWDACIIEAARASDCTELLSEDLADGRDYDGVVVRNPFAG